MYLAKIYLPVTHEENKDNFIRLTLSFNKDNYHWATSTTKEKGYQVHAVPVSKTTRTSGDNNYNVESSGAFTGFFEIIYPVERQSKKRAQKALEMIGENKQRYIEFFEKKGYKFLEQ